MTDLQLPARVGRYEVRRELGRGMMGIVYEAHDPSLKRRIALKTIRLAFAVSDEDRQRFEARFLTEARVAACLSHPGIVVVHDVGQDPDTGTLFIALEYLVGRPLSEVAGVGSPLEWRQALTITRRIAEALHHAHTNGVIHRDIKPANIMILDSGEPNIMDFGIAKIESSQLTSAGQFFGTPLYMSPEQARGAKIDARADLFSLGAMTYGLLTGQQAFGGASVTRIITRVLNEDPPPPTRMARGLPPSVDTFIARSLAKDPADRYPDALTMAEDIGDILADRAPRHSAGWTESHRAAGTIVSSHGAGPPRAESTKVPAARSTFPWFPVAIVALLLAIAGIGATLWLLHQRSKDRAARPTLAEPSQPITAAKAAPVDSPTPAAREGPAWPWLASPAEEPAHLAIKFEHTLRSGILHVWVDDDLVVEEELSSRVTNKVLTLKLRKGSVAQTLDLRPGQHEIQVQVAWDKNIKREHISGHFAAGATRRLSIKLGVGVGGFVKKDLRVEWD